MLANPKLQLLVLVVTCLSPIAQSVAADKTGQAWRFDFGSGPAAAGYTAVPPATLYDIATGYGFEPGGEIRSAERSGADPLTSDFCTSDRPFFFSVALPEGNYRVTVLLGAVNNSSTNTIKAELRRLKLENVITSAGHFATNTFTVNVRTARIPGDGEVRLKERERTSEMVAWDEKLTLEFNGARPCVAAVEITRDNSLPTLFLLGDSTVADQPNHPWNSWGQMLPRFLKPSVVVANHAQSGETLRSSLGARRLDKVLSQLKPGDHVFVQFGHNDMKSRATNALQNYEESLKLYVDRVKGKGAIPVLITSMERKAGVQQDTLGDYPDTVRKIAREEGVALIDLHAMSKQLYRALGDQLDKAFQDGSHHNDFGSYQLAKCVIAGIQQSRLPLAEHIIEDFTFDPSRPDHPDSFAVPASPGPSGSRPLGD
jgi:lysophospholipase L1-like esterase